MRSTLLPALLATLISALPVAAQDDVAVTGNRPYGPNVVFEKHEDWGPFCIWFGRDRDGSAIVGWENQQKCGTGVTNWGYDLDNDGNLDVFAYAVSCPGTNVLFLNWQWADGGRVTESASGVCIPDPPYGYKYSYYMTPEYEVVARNQPQQAWPQMKADCENKLTALQQRYAIAERGYRDAAANANMNRLAVKIAWHSYNRAWVTLEACKTFLRSQ
jgi:hypothetical protein